MGGPGSGARANDPRRDARDLRVLQLMARGDLSVVQVASRVGISTHAVYDILDRYGVDRTRRPHGPRQSTTNQRPPSPHTTVLDRNAAPVGITPSITVASGADDAESDPLLIALRASHPDGPPMEDVVEPVADHQPRRSFPSGLTWTGAT